MFSSRSSKPQPPEFAQVSGNRVRIAIENVDDAERFIEEERLRAAGYEVVGCGGPAELQGRCPLTEGRECPAVEQADIVVSSFGMEGAEGVEIVNAIRQRYPHTPVIVEAPPLVLERYGDALAGCHVLYPLTADRLIAAVEEIRGGNPPS